MDEINKKQPVCNVLFVEDNGSFRTSTIKKYLHSCRVVERYSGAKYSEILQSEDFHFILMDYELPDTTGEVLTRMTRSNGYRGPVIGISSSHYLNKNLLHGGADVSVEKRQSYLLPKIITQAISIAEARGYKHRCNY